MDVWTEEAGRVSLVAKSARGLKSRFKGQLEPFTPLLIDWVGRSELKTLTHAEVCGLPFDLMGNAMWCGFYVIELLIRMFRVESPYPIIFSAYEQVLTDLKKGDLQTPLRHFECALLQELGYGIPFSGDLQADQCYRFFPEKGFDVCEASDDAFVFSGRTLLALRDETAIEKDCQQEAKRLLRVSLQPILGNKPLKSREFFSSTVS